jgi:hypothetical protein
MGNLFLCFWDDADPGLDLVEIASRAQKIRNALGKKFNRCYVAYGHSGTLGFWSAVARFEALVRELKAAGFALDDVIDLGADADDFVPEYALTRSDENLVWYFRTRSGAMGRNKEIDAIGGTEVVSMMGALEQENRIIEAIKSLHSATPPTMAQQVDAECLEIRMLSGMMTYRALRSAARYALPRAERALANISTELDKCGDDDIVHNIRQKIAAIDLRIKNNYPNEVVVGLNEIAKSMGDLAILANDIANDARKSGQRPVVCVLWESFVLLITSWLTDLRLRLGKDKFDNKFNGIKIDVLADINMNNVIAVLMGSPTPTNSAMFSTLKKAGICNKEGKLLVNLKCDKVGALGQKLARVIALWGISSSPDDKISEVIHLGAERLVSLDKSAKLHYRRSIINNKQIGVTAEIATRDASAFLEDVRSTLYGAARLIEALARQPKEPPAKASVPRADSPRRSGSTARTASSDSGCQDAVGCMSDIIPEEPEALPPNGALIISSTEQVVPGLRHTSL